MPARFCLKAAGVKALTCFAIAVSATVLYSGHFQITRRKPLGYAQLVSVQPLPASDGQMCQWRPASAAMPLAAGLQQERVAAHPVAAASDIIGNSVNADRAPVRVIRDTYPTYSAVALDSQSDEVFLQDENLFGIKVFSRTDNTPPAAAFTEPKRVLGGIQTKLEFNCGIYVDPRSGDIYSVANDTVDTLVIFPHDAKGNVAPKRELKTPHGTYGIAVDEGAHTGLDNVDRIDVDPIHNEIIIPGRDRILVLPRDGSGDVAPLRVIRGPDTGLQRQRAETAAVDAVSNRIVVGTNNDSSFDDGSFLIFTRTDNGNVKPQAEITGPKTGIRHIAQLQVYAPKGWIVAAQQGSCCDDEEPKDAFVGIWSIHDNGDAPPRWIIGGPKSTLKRPRGVSLNPKNKELIVADMRLNAVLTYYFPEIF